MEEVLRFERVSFSYNGSRVIKDLSFSVRKGDFVGVVGPNGSGKSTLLKLASRVLEPQSGSVFLKGEKLDTLSRKELASQIASVPQVYHLDFSFTVEEVISMGLYPVIKKKKPGFKPKEKIEELLSRMELEGMRERFFPELSGGERQRVILAQALAQEPEVLLLDEPASNLDVSFQLKLFDFLKELNQQGMTIICVVHDLNLALSYFERIALLFQGEVLAEGAPEEVLQPALLEKVYGIKAVLHNQAGKFFLTFSTFPLKRKLRGKIHLICGGGSGSFLMRELTEAGFEVTAGVVNALDTDEVTGRELGLEMAVEAPFTSISEESFRKNTELIKRADLVILTDVPFGKGNFKNLQAFQWAAKRGKKVWLIGSEIGKRDFTGQAEEVLGKIEKAEFFKDEKEALKVLQEENWEI